MFYAITELILCLVLVVYDVRCSREVIDMSHVYDENTLFYDSNRYFKISDQRIFNHSKVWWALVKQFSMAEHGGTHFDAPNHFFPGAMSVEQIPITQFMGKAVVIDAGDKAEANNDYEVTVDDIKAWEAANGRIPTGAMIMLNFNWSVRWPDRDRVFGFREGEVADPNKAFPLNHYPGLHADAAKWLVENRGDIHAVGSDTVSVDIGQTFDLPTHRILLGNNILIFENVANLTRVPNFADIYALPMKIGGGTGGPIRIIAVVTSSARGGWASGWVVAVVVTMVFVMQRW